MSVKFRPLGDRVAISRIEAEKTTKAGIVIPDTASEKPVRGKVLSVGPGKVLDSGDVRALDLKVGDVVLFGKYAGTEVKLDGHDVVIMREEDILGVVTG